MTVAIWPDNLPHPQTESFQIAGPAMTQSINVLSGPTRVRLARRYAVPSFSFEIWLNEKQVEDFDAWYSECVEFDNGEMFLPWIGGGRVVAFTDEYVLVPLGRSWRLAATVTTLRIDPTLTDEIVCSTFGERVYLDNGISLNLLTGDLDADLTILYLPNVFTECGLIRNPGAPDEFALFAAEGSDGTDDQLIDDGIATDIVIDDFPLEDFEAL